MPQRILPLLIALALLSLYSLVGTPSTAEAGDADVTFTGRSVYGWRIKSARSEFLRLRQRLARAEGQAFAELAEQALKLNRRVMRFGREMSAFKTTRVIGVDLILNAEQRRNVEYWLAKQPDTQGGTWYVWQSGTEFKWDRQRPSVSQRTAPGVEPRPPSAPEDAFSGDWAKSNGWGAVRMTVTGRSMRGSWNSGADGYLLKGTVDPSGLEMRVQITMNGWKGGETNSEYVFTFNPETGRISTSAVNGRNPAWIARR